MTKTKAAARVPTTESDQIIKRVAALNWPRIFSELDAHGCAVIDSLLAPVQCAAIARMYPADEHFRSRVIMSRHGYGRGEYKYFVYPLPEVVAALRVSLYPPLAQLANRWNEAMAIDVRFPEEHADFIERCHAAGQVRPTPLVLQYGSGDFNVFPLQVAVLLKEPGTDFTGGEFVLTEQRPRMQSRVEVVPLRRGDGVIFPVRQRPVQGTRGAYRVNFRHGVSRVRSGNRHTLGIIFHDAR